jgi:hypothetical protein
MRERAEAACSQERLVGRLEDRLDEVDQAEPQDELECPVPALRGHADDDGVTHPGRSPGIFVQLLQQKLPQQRMQLGVVAGRDETERPRRVQHHRRVLAEACLECRARHVR